MKYYKYADDYSPISGGTTYIETDDGLAIRQITVNGDRYIVSNLRHPPWGLMLAEGRIDYDSLGDNVVEISPTEFETIWNTHLAKHYPQWQVHKRTYPVGAAVQGWIEIFYPQGVIVYLNDGTRGVADCAACKASSAPEWMYPGYKVTSIVNGYDEVNHWLVLERPKVHGEQMRDEHIS